MSRRSMYFVILFVLLWVWPAAGGEGLFLFYSDDRVRGDHQAPVTLLEYSDFTCGFCEKFFRETWPRLFSDYVQTGKLRLVYRDFPRALSGPGVDTALAARCAGEQGQYWTMHDRLFSTREKYGAGQLEHQADQLGLQPEEFSKCFQSGRHLESIFRDQQEGGSLGIRGTPGFVLYLTDQGKDGPLLVIPGAFPYKVFQEEIERLLNQAQDGGPSPSDTQDLNLPIQG